MKKIFSLFLVVLMVFVPVAVLASCGDNSSPDTLVMATNAAFPPYEYKDGNGFAGIDVEIAQAIADKLGKTLVIEDVEFGSIVGGVQSGKYDIGMAGMTVTDKRKESVNFSNTYATGVQVIIVKADSSYTSIDDFFNYNEEGTPISLKNPELKVGVQQDTTGDIYSASDLADWGFNTLNEDGSVKGTDHVVRFKTGAEAVAALTTDKVDCVIIDNEPAKSFVEQNAGKIKILETEYVEEDYAIAIKKENTQLLEDINKALTELRIDGTIDAIIEKYIPSK